MFIVDVYSIVDELSSSSMHKYNQNGVSFALL
jgi:hypothetical protein